MQILRFSASGVSRLADRWRRRPWLAAAAAAGAELAAALLPTSCAVCGAADLALCAGCRRDVRRSGIRPYYAQEAAGLLPPAEPAAGHPGGGAEPPVLPVLAAGRYAGSLARAVLAYKNHGRTDLAAVLRPILAAVLHQAADDAGRSGLVLVPVPGTGRALRRRGYSPLGLLLGTLRARGLLPAQTSLQPLVRMSGTDMRHLLHPGARRSAGSRGSGSSQKNLGRKGRRANVYGTMTAGQANSLTGVRCLVVDDVLTTGATIAEAARALRAAGATVEAAAVIAATSAPGV